MVWESRLERGVESGVDSGDVQCTHTGVLRRTRNRLSPLFAQSFSPSLDELHLLLRRLGNRGPTGTFTPVLDEA